VAQNREGDAMEHQRPNVVGVPHLVHSEDDHLVVTCLDLGLDRAVKPTGRTRDEDRVLVGVVRDDTGEPVPARGDLTA
jgi:hypothetical protein